MSREYDFTFKREPKPGWPCPRCGGMGTNADGFTSIGTDAEGNTRIQGRAPSKCHLCAGTGRVECVPAQPKGKDDGT